MSDGPVHATAVALWHRGGWQGALLRGSSGAGKSDMALRLMAEGWRLVGDDYVHVFASGGDVYAVPAGHIAGLIEARSVGILSTGNLPLVRLRLVVDCGHETMERLPHSLSIALAGRTVSALSLDIRPVSATALLTQVMRRL